MLDFFQGGISTSMDFIEKTKVQLGEKSGWNGGWVST